MGQPALGRLGLLGQHHATAAVSFCISSSNARIRFLSKLAASMKIIAAFELVRCTHTNAASLRTDAALVRKVEWPWRKLGGSWKAMRL